MKGYLLPRAHSTIQNNKIYPFWQSDFKRLQENCRSSQGNFEISRKFWNFLRQVSLISVLKCQKRTFHVSMQEMCPMPVGLSTILISSFYSELERPLWTFSEFQTPLSAIFCSSHTWSCEFCNLCVSFFVTASRITQEGGCLVNPPLFSDSLPQ